MISYCGNCTERFKVMQTFREKKSNLRGFPRLHLESFCTSILSIWSTFIFTNCNWSRVQCGVAPFRQLDIQPLWVRIYWCLRFLHPGIGEVFGSTHSNLAKLTNSEDKNIKSSPDFITHRFTNRTHTEDTHSYQHTPVPVPPSSNPPPIIQREVNLWRLYSQYFSYVAVYREAEVMSAERKWILTSLQRARWTWLALRSRLFFRRLFRSCDKKWRYRTVGSIGFLKTLESFMKFKEVFQNKDIFSYSRS